MIKRILTLSLCFLFVTALFLTLRSSGVRSMADSDSVDVFSPTLNPGIDPGRELEPNEPTASLPITARPKVEISPDGVCRVIEVPKIKQGLSFPTGCESVSAVMMLNFWGKTISVDEFVDEYLPKSNAFELRNGLLYGPDPYEVFVGSPRNPTSFGCMAPVIKKAMEAYLDEEYTVRDLTGKDLDFICRKYINHGIPVMVWATMNMRDSKPGISWYLENGEFFQWPNDEHCMVLVGYDENSYYFHDPLKGEEVLFAKSRVQSCFAQLGSQALAITR